MGLSCRKRQYKAKELCWPFLCSFFPLAAIALLTQCTAIAQPVTFNCSGISTTFTAPATGLYHIVANGAQGGDGFVPNNSGGFGAQVSGDFSLTAGQMLSISVGCVGGTAAFAGGGGGGSFVVFGATPLLIAAGGGGAGVSSNGSAGNSGPNGGSASGAGGTNGSGGKGGTDFCCNGGGGAGFFSPGGDGSTPGSGGQAYPSLAGGNGFTGGGFGGGGGGDLEGGGGGGGYSGGGGGGPVVSGGGGGGSFNASLNPSASSNASGNGSVTITLLSITDAFQVSYASNLNMGDTYANITNTGASAKALLNPGKTGSTAQNNIDGNICVNIYAFAADEQEVACCSCLVTPNALWSASVKTALLNSTLTPSFPNEVVIKLISSVPNVGTNNTQSCNPASITAAGIVTGVAAWGTSVHGVPTSTGPTFQMAETPFASATLSPAELARDVQECQFIQLLGSGQFGICKGCSNVGLGAAGQ